MVDKLPCSKCHKWLPEDEYPTTADWLVCEHWKLSVCPDCITKHIETTAKSVPIEKLPCPEPKCHGHLGYFQMKKYAPEPLFERYDHRVNVQAFTDGDIGSLTLDGEKYVSCSRLGCEWASMVDEANTTSWVRCQVCGAETCVSCLRPWHSGKSCHDAPKTPAAEEALSFKAPSIEVGDPEAEVPVAKQHEAEQLREQKPEVSDLPSFKKCPNCRARIEKSGGCGHMTCPLCRHEFCWDCRADYEKVKAQGGSAGHKPGCIWHTQNGFLDGGQ